jgi:hypothetical protein
MEKDKMDFLIILAVLLAGGALLDVIVLAAIHFADNKKTHLCGFHAVRHHSQDTNWVLDPNRCDECSKLKEEA